MKSAPRNLFFVLVPIFWWKILPAGAAPFHEALLLYFQPNYSFLRACVRSHTLPLWNPYIYSGVPFLANLQSAVFYPFSYIYALIPFVPSLKLNLMLHSIIALYLFYALCRSLSLSNSASFLGAIVYVFNGFFVLHYAFPSHLNSMVWMPGVILFTHRYSEKRRVSDILWGAIIFCVQIFAGYPQFVIYSVICAIAFGLIAKDRPAYFKGIILILLFGGLLSSVQIFPALELASESPRLKFGLEKATLFSLLPMEMARMLLPQWSWYFTPKSGDMNIVGMYFGPIVMGLAGYSLHKGQWKYTAPLMGLVFCALFISLGENAPGYKFFYATSGFMRFFRYPPQAMLMACFGISLMAAFGLERLSLTEKGSVAVMALVFMDFWFFSAKAIRTIPAEFYSTKTPTIDYLERTAGTFRMFVPGRTLQNKDWRGNNFFEAWCGFKNALLPNIAMTYGLYDAGGSEVLRFRDYDRLLESIYQHVDSPWLNILGIRYFISLYSLPPTLYTPVATVPFVYENRHAYPKTYFTTDAVFFSRGEMIEQVDKLGAAQSEGKVFVEGALSPASAKKNRRLALAIMVQQYGPNRVSVDFMADQDGWLVLTDAFDAGWRATDNALPVSIERVNFLQRGIKVGPGLHAVEFQYDPPLFRLGLWVSLFAWLALLTAYGYNRRP